MDPVVGQILVAIIGAAGIISAALVTVVFGRKISETHKTLTTNHHSSATPTIRDELAELKEMFMEHLQDHKKGKK